MDGENKIRRFATKGVPEFREGIKFIFILLPELMGIRTYSICEFTGRLSENLSSHVASSHHQRSSILLRWRDDKSENVCNLLQLRRERKFMRTTNWTGNSSLLPQQSAHCCANCCYMSKSNLFPSLYCIRNSDSISLLYGLLRTSLLLFRRGAGRRRSKRRFQEDN